MSTSWAPRAALPALRTMMATAESFMSQSSKDDHVKHGLTPRRSSKMGSTRLGSSGVAEPIGEITQQREYADQDPGSHRRETPHAHRINGRKGVPANATITLRRPPPRHGTDRIIVNLHT